jgi:hypothetical protein
LLRFLGIIKPKYTTGKRARVFVDGREVAFEKGENVVYNFNPKPIKVLGNLEVAELFDNDDVEVKVVGRNEK